MPPTTGTRVGARFGDVALGVVRLGIVGRLGSEKRGEVRRTGGDLDGHHRDFMRVVDRCNGTDRVRRQACRGGIGIGVYGCDEIMTGYRYSPTTGEYVQMDRFGALFKPAPFEPNVKNERFGGMFVFSTRRCTMESRVAPETLAGAKVSLFGGQLLSITPAWNGKEAGSIVQECASQSGTQASQVQFSKWDAKNQEWITPAQSASLSNGEVWKILPKGECELELG